MYAIAEERGLELIKDEQDRYVNGLIATARHGRDERFIDRMLIASAIECRGAERFGILANTLDAGPLRSLYERLWKAETKHGHLFAHLLLQYFPADVVYPRLEEIMRTEADIISKLTIRPALH